ncbi:hypothetical protein EX30DRAFT_357366 [Ascodesmis nigricans]|uniref:Uncharacterized protein n=1 Tax=Ascodesmis nigricans TaxID=341454 RepID=A0A4S2N8D5_9PEZI|nr:hypothetical protein EX30DRAFT_357366 [Ascodesmis nigricans]
MESRSPSPISGSPAATPLLGQGQHFHTAPATSKRDKRRNALSDKLVALTAAFHNPANPRVREQYYRAQLSSLQVDMQLIAKADVSGQNMQLLDDSPDTIQREVEAMFAGTLLGRDVIADQGMAGKLYSQFLEEINNAMETRDTDLALLYQAHCTKARSISLQHMRALVLAKEEHRALAQTIQQRISTRLKAQLRKIAAEKESSSFSANALSSLSAGGAFDITETNALLLHPSQFGSTTGVGSPRRHGGREIFDDDNDKDTTRRKARRRGEVEELMGYSTSMTFDSPTTNGKRKRRGQDVDEVPTPTAPESVSPILPTAEFPPVPPDDEPGSRKIREELLKQVYTPTYSLEKLFNDKELLHHGNLANLATVRYFSERGHEYSLNAPDPTTTGDEGTPAPSNTPLPPQGGDDDDDDTREHNGSPFGDLPFANSRMPGVNTRSNPPRNGDKDADNLAVIGLPPVGMTYVNKSGLAPPPPPLRSEDADSDLAAISKALGEKRPADTSGPPGKKQRRN